MFCSHCGSELSPNSTTCTACGKQTTVSSQDSQTAGASTTLTLEDMYRAFIGPAKAHYYLSVFQRFDENDGLISWNWPAAFFTSYWMIYRAMLLWGIIYYPLLSLAAGIMLYFPFTMVMGIGSDNLYSLFTFALAFFVMGMFSNKLYHNHVHKMIDKSQELGLNGQEQYDWLAKKGASKLGALILILVLFILLGILAAIAIPAYQEYVIRAQQSALL